MRGRTRIADQEHVPSDAITVAAGDPEVPEPLLAQLAVGGRLAIPIAPTPRAADRESGAARAPPCYGQP
ncbi:MAG: hypothetical protein ACRERC_20075 [Candidatus Binatia bacterium]